MLTKLSREYFLVLDDVMEQLEEYGEYHEDGCQCMLEDPDACDCNMHGLKPLISQALEKAYQEGFNYSLSNGGKE